MVRNVVSIGVYFYVVISVGISVLWGYLYGGVNEKVFL